MEYPSVRKRRTSKSAVKQNQWQDLSDKNKKPSFEGFTSIFLVGFVIAFAIASILSVHLHYCLPDPQSPNEDNTRFSEVRAMPILKELSDYGPKPAGSYACEELTRSRIIKELEVIQQNSATELRFEIATQNPSGCFSLPKFDTDGFSICYKNVSNVIARIGESSQPDRIAVLLNCHYDSWPTSSGGSDDLSSCALMLELLRVLTRHPSKLKHDVIFLFNGAEESSLLAAHGFITAHPWRHSIRAFINLEASGSGGRELLFQAGPANEWLLNSYLEAAVHPHCSVLGQEIFQSGVYPGDTDYRIFRDYGRIPGLDLAFVQNGYWWHTEFDEASRIRPGSLQRAGDNVLAVLEHLLSSPYLSAPAEFADQKSVFFDFLGLFVVVYPLSMANWLNLITVFLITAKTFKGFLQLRDLGISSDEGKSFSYSGLILANLLFYIWMLGFGYALTHVVGMIFGKMLWYSAHYLLIPLYAIPLFVAALLFSLILKRTIKRDTESFVRCYEDVSDCLLGPVLLFFVYKNIASAYLIFIQLIPALAPIFEKTLPLEDASHRRALSRSLLALPGITLLVYTSALLISIFVPIMGRTSSNPEPLVMFFVAFAVVPASRIVLSVSLRTKRASLIRVILLLGSIIGMIFLVIGLERRSPYHFTHEYPMAKRTQLFHVNRHLFDENSSLIEDSSLLYAISHDDRGADDIPFVAADKSFEPIKCVFDETPYCEIPFYFPTRGRIKERHIRYKRTKPFEELGHRQSNIIVRSKNQTSNHIKYALTFEGSGQMSVYVTALGTHRISACSMAEQVDGDEKNMFLYFTCSGENCGEWKVDIDVVGPLNIQKPLLVGVTSHYLHGSKMQSEEVQQILHNISTRRRNDDQWAVTSSAWSVDMLYKYL